MYDSPDVRYLFQVLPIRLVRVDLFKSYSQSVIGIGLSEEVVHDDGESSLVFSIREGLEARHACHDVYVLQLSRYRLTKS